MNDRTPKPDDRTQYGGQAVVEGVMMRSPRYFAIACRLRSTNEILVKLEPVSSALPPWLKWLNRPFLRGSAALVDAMAMGIRSLTYSANVQLEDEEKSDPTGRKPGATNDVKAAAAVNLAIGEGMANPGIRKPTGSVTSQSINGITIGATTVLALFLGFALFWLVPAAVTDLLIRHHASAATLFAHPAGGGRRALEQFGASLVEGIIRLIIFFVYLAGVSRLAHVQRVFEYHGAEHKAINALEARLPMTVESARSVSRIHPRCGTNFIFIVLITAILVFSVVPRHGIQDGIGLMLSTHLLRLLLLPVVAGIAFEILKFAGAHRDKAWAMALIAPGLWTQYITTREPDDSQIEVALKSLMAVWDKEHEAFGGETDVAAAVA